MQVQIKIVIPQDFKVDEEIKGGTKELVQKMVLDGTVILLAKMPYATGQFLRSIRHEVKEEGDVIKGSIYADPNAFPKAYYPIVVEYGSKPHRPPLKPLITWAYYKFGVPMQVAVGIAEYVREVITERGTRPQYLFRSVAEELAKKYAVGKIEIITRANR